MAPGRPSLKVTIDFNDPIKALDNVKTLFDNKKFKENIKLFAKILLKDTDELVTVGTQIENDTVVQNIIELTSDMCSYERSFLMSNI